MCRDVPGADEEKKKAAAERSGGESPCARFSGGSVRHKVSWRQLARLESGTFARSL